MYVLIPTKIILLNTPYFIHLCVHVTAVCFTFLSGCSTEIRRKWIHNSARLRQQTLDSKKLQQCHDDYTARPPGSTSCHDWNAPCARTTRPGHPAVTPQGPGIRRVNTHPSLGLNKSPTSPPLLIPSPTPTSFPLATLVHLHFLPNYSKTILGNHPYCPMGLQFTPPLYLYPFIYPNDIRNSNFYPI